MANLTSAEQPEECEGASCSASPDTPRWLCADCDCTYCDLCWARQGPHKRGKLNKYGLPHEKDTRQLNEALKAVFSSPRDMDEICRLHREDVDTLWFAVDGIDPAKKADEKVKLHDTGRYSTLMTITKPPTVTERYPLLVSFVGQTGNGKSTIIKMLISLTGEPLASLTNDLFKTPVTGSSRNDRSPTSGDVHLYLDPETAFGDLPMLYADCEGLDGGETKPQAKSALMRFIKGEPKPEKPEEIPEFAAEYDMVIPVDNKNQKIGTREYAVRAIYPRLLYTFSDTIVFVLKNTRTFESSALKLLLEWASRSLESSVNQAVLPQLIVVLNDCDGTDEDEWNVDTATTRLMEYIKNAHYTAPLQDYTEKWAKRGKMIKSTEQLLRFYYSNIRVVDRLHKEISESCSTSFKAKWEARQYCTTDELNRYLQAAFNHFSAKPNEPFNFIEVALKADPIPQGFAAHIVALAVAASERSDTGHVLDSQKVFERMSPLIASCIMLDRVRYKRPGKPEDLFDQHYKASCATALERFARKWVRCAYKSSDRKKGQCVNSKALHSKGHQTARGRIMGLENSFQDPFDADAFRDRILELIRSNLVEIEEAIREACSAPSNHSNTREKVSFDLHKKNIIKFFSGSEIAIAGFNSCYSCLMESPQHPLTCGHTLCRPCVKMLGRVSDQHTVTLDFCPLEQKNSRTFNASSIRFKPDFAGIRILTLDGGGVRGIVELETLVAVENTLGKGLPIQNFFDLIVGTSTGGIIALALGVKQWSVDECITKFVSLCKSAFKAHDFANTKYLSYISMSIHKAKYKTSPIHNILKDTFGEDKLYGHIPADAIMRDTKVAVTATSASAENGILIGNYTRQSEDEHWYRFKRGDDMPLWAAARATSAAPGYFTRLSAKEQGDPHAQEYLDGAVYFNNPVRLAVNERRFLWPDMAEAPPDIVLSLGTGRHGAVVDALVNEEAQLNKISAQSRAICCPEHAVRHMKTLLKNEKGKRKNGLLKNTFETLRNMIDNQLNAEREFKLFQADHANIDTADRYIRLNPDLNSSPPPLDDIENMHKLHGQVKNIYRQPYYQIMAERVAFRLMASAFYFSKESSIVYIEASHVYLCKGRIACRFEGRAKDMQVLLREVGNFFRRQSTADFNPYFIVKKSLTDTGGVKIEIDRSCIDDMTQSAHFHVGNELEIVVPNKRSMTTIYLCLQTSDGSEPELYPLSGFPRLLVTEDESTTFRLRKRAELIRSKISESEEHGEASLHDLLNRDSRDSDEDSELTRPSTKSSRLEDEVKETFSRLRGRTSVEEARMRRMAIDESVHSPKTEDSSGTRPTKRMVIGNSVSAPDIRRKMDPQMTTAAYEQLDSDDEALINALRSSSTLETKASSDTSLSLVEKDFRKLDRDSLTVGKESETAFSISEPESSQAPARELDKGDADSDTSLSDF